MEIPLIVRENQYMHCEDVVPCDAPLPDAYISDDCQQWYIWVDTVYHMLKLVDEHKLTLQSDGERVVLYLDREYSEAPVYSRGNVRRCN